MIQLLQTPAAGARVPPGRGLQSAYLSAPTGRTKSALIVTQDFSPGRPRSGATRSGGSRPARCLPPTTQKRIPAKLISFFKDRRRSRPAHYPALRDLAVLGLLYGRLLSSY